MAIFLRRQDGLVKLFSNVQTASNGVYNKQGTSYRCKYTLPSYNGDGHLLHVCEQDVGDDIVSQEPFVRSLPGILGHELFFGDLLLVHVDPDYVRHALTLDDMRSFFEGTHPQWCMRAIRDVGQKEEKFEEDEEEDDEEEDDEEEETRVSEDDEDVTIIGGNEDSDEEESDDDDETVP